MDENFRWQAGEQFDLLSDGTYFAMRRRRSVLAALPSIPRPMSLVTATRAPMSRVPPMRRRRPGAGRPTNSFPTGTLAEQRSALPRHRAPFHG